MGAASAKFDELKVSGSGVSTIQEISQNLITNSDRLMKNLSAVMDLLDTPLNKIIEENFENDIVIEPDGYKVKELKETILQQILQKIKIFYSDKLSTQMSMQVLQKVSKNLNYGLEIDDTKFIDLIKKRNQKQETSIKSRLNTKFGTTLFTKEELPFKAEEGSLMEAKKKLANEIVSLFIDKYLILYHFNKMLKQSDDNRSVPQNQPNEYLEDYVKIYQSRFNVSGRRDLVDEDLNKEIEYRYRNLSDALKDVYKDINQNFKSLNKATNSKEVDKVKQELKRSPNKNLMNLCKALDQSCDIIDLDKKSPSEIEQVKARLNKNSRKKQVSDICKPSQSFNLYSINKLESPCKDPDRTFRREETKKLSPKKPVIKRTSPKKPVIKRTSPKKPVIKRTSPKKPILKRTSPKITSPSKQPFISEKPLSERKQKTKEVYQKIREPTEDLSISRAELKEIIPKPPESKKEISEEVVSVKKFKEEEEKRMREEDERKKKEKDISKILKEAEEYERSIKSQGSESPVTESQESKSQESESPVSESPVIESQESKSQESESQESKSPVIESQESESQESKSPVIESPVTESPVTESPVSESQESESPVSESPVSESQKSESQESKSPVSESPLSESPVTESQESKSQESKSQESESPVTESQESKSQGSESPVTESQGSESQASPVTELTVTESQGSETEEEKPEVITSVISEIKPSSSQDTTTVVTSPESSSAVDSNKPSEEVTTDAESSKATEEAESNKPTEEPTTDASSLTIETQTSNLNTENKSTNTDDISSISYSQSITDENTSLNSGDKLVESASPQDTSAEVVTNETITSQQDTSAEILTNKTVSSETDKEATTLQNKVKELPKLQRNQSSKSVLPPINKRENVDSNSKELRNTSPIKQEKEVIGESKVPKKKVTKKNQPEEIKKKEKTRAITPERKIRLKKVTEGPYDILILNFDEYLGINCKPGKELEILTNKLNKKIEIEGYIRQYMQNLNIESPDYGIYILSIQDGIQILNTRGKKVTNIDLKCKIDTIDSLINSMIKILSNKSDNVKILYIDNRADNKLKMKQAIATINSNKGKKYEINFSEMERIPWQF
jgi:hypothetical protein